MQMDFTMIGAKRRCSELHSVILNLIIMIAISKYNFKTDSRLRESNSGVYKVQLEECLTLRQIYERFKKGYPLDRSLIRHDDEGQYYSDDDIDKLTPPNYSAEFDDFDNLVKELSEVEEVETERLSEERSNEQKSKVETDDTSKS